MEKSVILGKSENLHFGKKSIILDPNLALLDPKWALLDPKSTLLAKNGPKIDFFHQNFMMKKKWSKNDQKKSKNDEKVKKSRFFTKILRKKSEKNRQKSAKFRTKFSHTCKQYIFYNLCKMTKIGSKMGPKWVQNRFL